MSRVMGLHALVFDCYRSTVNSRWWRLSRCELHSTTCGIAQSIRCILIDQTPLSIHC